MATRAFAPCALAPAMAAWCAMLALIAPAARAADSVALPLPLEGAPYRVAQQSLADYNAHRYADSIAEAREAIRQRPDVADLRVLLANGLASSGHLKEASRELSAAIAQLGPQRVLVARRKQIDDLLASGGEGGELSDLNGPAFKEAQRAYKAYDAKDYDAAITAVREAIGHAPDVNRLRYLLIDALDAAGRDDEAYDEALAATRQFGEDDALRARRVLIGNKLAQADSRAADAVRQRGDLAAAATLAQRAVERAPQQMNFRLQAIDLLFAQNDLAGVENMASGATQQAPDNPLAWTLLGYARAARHEAGADDAFARALAIGNAAKRDTRMARTIVADVWLAEGRPQAALDALAPLGVADETARDDTDAAIALRRFRARRALAASGAAFAASAPGASSPSVSTNAPVDPTARPVFDCRADQYGAACDVYAADPGFGAARLAREAIDKHESGDAVEYAREAADAVPDDIQYQSMLLDALAARGDIGDTREARQVARRMIDNGMLDGMPDLQAGFIAQQAGDARLALHYFEQADTHGKLPASTLADMGYANLRMHRNQAGAKYLERAIDAGSNPADGDEPATPQALADERAAHAEATRNWGITASVNYRDGGAQNGVLTNPVPGAANNWQAGVEAYWRPFGSLGDRMFEVYARQNTSFGVDGNQPSGLATTQDAIGARVKPFGPVNAIFAFEHIFPIGSAARSDWLARAAWSGGFGTALGDGPPSWWTGVAYGEVGHYIQQSTTYATTNARFGRTFRLDSISPNLTVFPHLVVGADYDSAIDHSVPVGIGAGVSTRFWFRGDQYNAPRSFVDLSVQYRFRLAGDDRARGVFFGAVFSY